MDNLLLYLFFSQAIGWISACLPNGFTIAANAPYELEVSWTTPGVGDVPGLFTVSFLEETCSQDDSPCGPFTSEQGGAPVTVTVTPNSAVVTTEDTHTGIAALEVTLLRKEGSDSILIVTVVDDTNSAEVTYALDDASTTALTKTTPFEIIGLTARTEYTYVVTASVGDLTKSLTVTEYTGLLPSPTALVKDTENTNAIKLGVTWFAPADGTLAGFIILVSGPDTDSEPETLSKSDTSYIREGLTPESEYTVTLVAFYDDSNHDLKSYEVSVEITTLALPPPPPPPPPSPVDFAEDKSSTTHNQLGVTWSEPSDDSFTGYGILVSGPNTDSKTEMLSDTDTSYIREDLTPASTYTVTLVAVYDDGNSDEETITITTHAPPSPTDLSEDKTNTKHNKLGVTWSDPSDDSFIEYIITVYGHNTDSEKETLDKMESSYIREGLKPASAYTVTLVAVYDDVNSAEETLTITTLNDPNANNGSPSTYVSYKQICGWMAVFICLYGSLLEG